MKHIKQTNKQQKKTQYVRSTKHKRQRKKTNEKEKQTLTFSTAYNAVKHALITGFPFDKINNFNDNRNTKKNDNNPISIIISNSNSNNK